MATRKHTARQVTDALRTLNREDLRGELVAGIINAGVLARVGRYRVIRPDDLLVLNIALDNLVVRNGKLARQDAAKPGLLIVGHQLQAITERAFQPGQGLAAPAPARGAGPSRLVFRMPDAGAPVPFTLEGILEACRTWELKLNWAAQPAPPPETQGSGLSFDWRDAVRHAGTVSSLLEESARQLFGERATVSLRSAGKALARGMGGQAPRGGRAAFQKQVRQLAHARLGTAVEADLQIARAYVEAVAAVEFIGALRPGVDVGVDLGKLWPYLMHPSAPSAVDTSIELPYRLMGSPLATAGFDHALAPVERGGRTELWHTRLGARTADGGIDDRAVQPLRYLWTPDFDGNASGPLDTSLNWLDRQMIVKLTAGYAYRIREKRDRYTPRPVDVSRLHLTALGGALDLGKSWKEQPEGVDLVAWTHRANLGRDFYVRVEYSGYLFPFGHRASLIKVTERKFEKSATLGAVAPLRTRYFIVVRDRMRAFNGAAPQPDAGRGLPFDRIECLTQITPDLQKPGQQQRDLIGAGSSSAPPTGVPPLYANTEEFRMAFWPALADGSGTNMRFQFVGVDGAGRRIPFDAPLVFVSDLKNTTGHLGRIVADYATETGRREPSLGGATVRMAPVAAPDAADVDLPVSALRFLGKAPAGTYAYNTARFFPDVELARVRLPAVERLTGKPVNATAQYPDVYRQQGFSAANPGQVFLSLATDLLDFGGASLGDKAGGVASPNLRPSALSRAFGLGSGDLQKLASDQFDPAEFFNDDSAKLLGFVPLKLLLNAASSMVSGAGAPRLDTRELPDRVVARLHLQQDNLKPPAGFDQMLLLNAGGNTSRLTLDSVTTAWLDPSRPPESVADGEMTHFKVNLFGCIVLWFDRLHFRSQAGHKPEVDVDLNPAHAVTFGGPLEFVNTLKDLIPANGFSDPPGLAVTPQGITASFSLALPNVQVGILALSNISLGAAFNLPFTGDRPSLRFNFAERHNTFNLTVSLFGGGGFFAIGVDTGGVNEIEAALEFGASVSIDLGVASGSVYVKGGFYFHYSQENVHFEGYVEMGGRLRVIGLISVSLTFHLSLAYECKQKSGPNALTTTRLYGQASLVVEVEILFFSASVTVKVKREFAGAESDPTFADFIPDDSTWQDYCLAYA